MLTNSLIAVEASTHQIFGYISAFNIMIVFFILAFFAFDWYCREDLKRIKEERKLINENV